MVQWLVGLHAFTAEGLGLIPGWGTKIPQNHIAKKERKKKSEKRKSKCIKRKSEEIKLSISLVFREMQNKQRDTTLHLPDYQDLGIRC